MVFTVTMLLFPIGQTARKSGCDWFIQLSDNRCAISAFCYRTLSDKKIDVRL